jgi:serine/threonine protein kinase
MPVGPGTAVGRYEIVTLLGAGGMARVYLAVQRGPFGADRIVVLKQLRPEVAEDPQFLSLFVDEARIALRLNHPNVVHTYDVVNEPGQYCLAMEYLEGHSLFEIIRRVGRANVPLAEHIFILTQILAGLHYAHQLCDFDGTALGIVHRDVSPANVFVTLGGEVKLLDFGIAKATSAISSTKEGTVKGKVGYAAPEQLVGKHVDAKADIYSVGVMLWEAMARRRRSSADTLLAMMQARLSGGEPSIYDVWPDAPPSLVKICDRALAPLPQDRQSALELAADLEAYLTDTPVGQQQLAEFMSRHFHEDTHALRTSIARSFLGSSKDRSEPSLPTQSSVQEKHSDPVAGWRRATAWVAVAAVLVAIALLARAAPRAVASSPSATTVPSPLASVVPVATMPIVSAVQAPAAAPREAPPIAQPASTNTISVKPSVATRRRRLPPVSASAAQVGRNEPSTEAPPADRARVQAETSWEPGADLRSLAPARRARALDEKDPYTP